MLDFTAEQSRSYLPLMTIQHRCLSILNKAHGMESHAPRHALTFCIVFWGFFLLNLVLFIGTQRTCREVAGVSDLLLKL